MIVFGIAIEMHVTHGHNSVDNLVLRKGDVYGFGDFQPLFKTREKARAYQRSLNHVERYGTRIVELLLMG